MGSSSKCILIATVIDDVAEEFIPFSQLSLRTGITIVRKR